MRLAADPTTTVRRRPRPRSSSETTTFKDVGGLDAVKQAIHRTIVLPFQRPDLFERYGRKAGGGVLLYGPPGCGKTLLARATAGECGVPFLNVRIEDVLDPWLGVSEKNLHEAFLDARERAPAVLFLDELDALGLRPPQAAGQRRPRARGPAAAGAGLDRLRQLRPARARRDQRAVGRRRRAQAPGPLRPRGLRLTARRPGAAGDPRARARRPPDRQRRPRRSWPSQDAACSAAPTCARSSSARWTP